MRLAIMHCRIAATSAVLVVALAACDGTQPAATASAAEPVPEVTFAVPEMPEPAPVRSEPSRPLCDDRMNLEYTRLSNGWGHGSPYFSMLSRCSDDIRLDIDFYTETDALFAFESDRCPGVRVTGNVIPKSAAISDHDYIRSVKELLKDRLVSFREGCGLGSTAGDEIFEGFDEIYAGEMRASWIHNRYIDKLASRNRLGWPDEELAREAREEYARTH